MASIAPFIVHQIKGSETRSVSAASYRDAMSLRTGFLNANKGEAVRCWIQRSAAK
jgi:hypothetical protein